MLQALYGDEERLDVRLVSETFSKAHGLLRALYGDEECLNGRLVSETFSKAEVADVAYGRATMYRIATNFSCLQSSGAVLPLIATAIATFNVACGSIPQP